MAFHVITAQEAMEHDPRLCAPPLCTDDGDVRAVGTAHGRVLPLVGNTRPYLFDVSSPTSTQRIYADKLTDVLCVLLGGEYADIVAQMSEGLTERIAGVDTPAAGDLLPLSMVADAGEPQDPWPAPPEENYAAYQQLQELLYEAGRMRASHADRIRIDLQQQINEQAIADGTWELLTDAERNELTVSAELDGGHPVGIPAEIPIMVTDAETGALTSGVMVRPEWRARTRLVLSTGDYEPWADAPYPTSLQTIAEDDGRESDYLTRENIIELVIDTEAEYIRSLSATGVLVITERPAHQPDAMFAEMTDDPIVNPYLRRDQSVAD